MGLSSAKLQCDDLVGDPKIDVHFRRIELIKMGDLIMKDKPSLNIVTEPNVKFDFDVLNIRNLVNDIILEDCDQPHKPFNLKSSKITSTDFLFTWSILNTNQNKPV